ncbi:MAG: hypothetical protein IBX70_07790 [Clostridia bacterium]|nr:hypothetical protein [Clostridia bacterium]
MGNVIDFSKAKLKMIEKLQNEAAMDSMVDKEPLSTHIGVPVKFLHETSEEEYYVFSKIGSYIWAFNTSNHIKLPLNDMTNKSKWIYPQPGSGVSRFEMENIGTVHKNYVFLNRVYENVFIDWATFNYKHDKTIIETFFSLPPTMQLEFDDGYRMPLNHDKANEFGLVLARENELEFINFLSLSSAPISAMYSQGAKVIAFDESLDVVILEGVLLREGVQTDFNNNNLISHNLNNILSRYAFKIMKNETEEINLQLRQLKQGKDTGGKGKWKSFFMSLKGKLSNG